MTRRDYEKRFSKFPDVVTVNEFRAMLGGICECTARNMLKADLIEHFVIRSAYYIPKKAIIDYLMTDHYQKYRQKLRHSII